MDKIVNQCDGNSAQYLRLNHDNFDIDICISILETNNL